MFLSANAVDVQSAASYGIAAATVVPMEVTDDGQAQLRVAFDGDSTILGSSGDAVFKEFGIELELEVKVLGEAK